MKLLQSLSHLMISDGDCLRWRAGTTGNGHPIWRIGGKSELVRRALWQESRGPITDGRVLRVTCGTPRCGNVDHLALMTRADLSAQCGAMGLMSGYLRSAHIAAAKRAGPTAKLTEALAREIRHSAESGAVVARRMGVTQKLVSQIRRGERWREYGRGPMNHMVEVLG